MKFSKARASKKRKGHPSSSTTSQPSNNEELSPVLKENVPKKKGRPSKNAAAIAAKGKGVDDGGESANAQPTMLTRSWTRSGKVARAMEPHREEAGSEEHIGTEGEPVADEESGPGEERPSKRQKQNVTAQDNGESSSSSRALELPVQTLTTPKIEKTKSPISPPKTATPKVKKVKTPKQPKTIKPKKPKKIKPPKGVRIRTTYISNPAAVFIRPIEITHEDMKDFTHDLLNWSLYPRTLAARIGCPEREHTDPPKETLKKWRAYCAFPGLDRAGTREEMWERLREHFRLSGLKYVAGTPEYEAIIESERVRGIIDREEGNSYDVSWSVRNEAERTRLWGLLSPEQQFERNISLFITENISTSNEQDVWVFKSRGCALCDIIRMLLDV
ncbi:hypothetical protein OCU04_001437 [Sclerotinia nivalis]|uniref:SAP domain-containing protein n=1 Tax=Sclerotinia nivalis TaxID=352851 RepID=A0A9X0AYS3_9HELO|nr:hypothetical protein OCU04_001437 [Sclerotinia nivalis]